VICGNINPSHHFACDANLGFLNVKRHYLVYENDYYTIMKATQNYPMHLYIGLHFPCRESYKKDRKKKRGLNQSATIP
jgi:hypothetical protein